MKGKFGKNQWKVVLLSITGATVSLVFVISLGIVAYRYAVPRYAAFQESRKKQEEDGQQEQGQDVAEAAKVETPQDEDGSKGKDIKTKEGEGSNKKKKVTKKAATEKKTAEKKDSSKQQKKANGDTAQTKAANKNKIDAAEKNKSERQQGEENTSDSHNVATPINAANILGVSATSYLDESQYHIVHPPENLLDGNLSTGWVEGVSGQGIGESVTVYFDGMHLVSGFQIYAGYQKSSDLYDKNSRPEGIYVGFSDGSGESHTLADVCDVQNIQFANSVLTDCITLRIDSVYPGNKYEDTVISEISLY